MTTELKIAGMNCQHCVRSVTQALAAVPGAERVTVDLASGQAQVSGSPEVDSLIAAVVEAGFAAEVTRSAP